jgi:hypothetical protein
MSGTLDSLGSILVDLRNFFKPRGEFVMELLSIGGRGGGRGGGGNI